MRSKGKKSDLRLLLLDVGGVLLTNGWDHHARQRAAAHFGLDYEILDQRHRLMFETHERGHMSFDEYLDQLVFYKKRSFKKIDLKKFIFTQSKPYPPMLDLISKLKEKYQFRVIILSNESREINRYRIEEFRLQEIADIFLTSCYVHLRKPDTEIFRLALDVAQVARRHILYLDNTALFIDVAAKMGIRGILHEDFATTRKKFAEFGLSP